MQLSAAVIRRISICYIPGVRSQGTPVTRIQAIPSFYGKQSRRSNSTWGYNYLHLAMVNSTESEYGAWKSPISSEIAGGGEIQFCGLERDFSSELNSNIFWLEQRPAEGGRNVVCSWNLSDRKIVNWTPANFDVKTKVHEYGGGAFCIFKNVVYFVNKNDQRIYFQTGPEATPQFLTQLDPVRRFADLHFSEFFNCLFAVCEDIGIRKEETEFSEVKPECEKKIVPDNYIVSVDVKTGDLACVVKGADFYSNPRTSKTGYLVWLEWNMPNMPWDNTNLRIAKMSKRDEKVIGASIWSDQSSGDKEVAFTSPEFPVNGGLLYISDETNWWNLYFHKKGQNSINLDPVRQDLGHPPWIFGMHSFTVAPKGQDGKTEIFLTYGKEIIAVSGNNGFTEIQRNVVNTGFKYHHYYIQSVKGGIYGIGYDAKTPMTLFYLDLAQNEVTKIQVANNLNLDGYLSEAEEIDFPTTNGETAFGYFYPPTNRDFHAPKNSLPPLLVTMHGGPTHKAFPVLKLSTQFYTSRGFGMLDVNYRGSSSFGRAFRQKLNGQWGVMDVDDAVNGVKYLIEKGLADPNRVCIAGGSAGGLSVLNALLFHDTFKAGASHYGVTDLEALVADTHKFEMRYMDILIGPYPAAKSIYEARSPIFNKDRLKCPVIFFQGSEDAIVPPSQAESMFNAVKEKKLPCAYVLFEGEGHGFTKKENIQKALSTEFAFFAKVFKINAPHVECDVKIENLPE